MPQGQIHSPIFYVVIGLLVIGLFAWRIRRMTQSRPLRLEWLWVTPALLAALTVLSLVPQPPHGIGWAVLAVGLVVGGGLGWWRGKMMHISVDPETHALNTRASAAGLIFIVAIIVIRMGLRSMALSEASTLHVSVSVITGAFMTFAVGLFGVQRLEMAIRANRLLTEARQAKAAAVP